MAAQRNIKARYRVKDLGEIELIINAARMVKETGSEVPSKQDKQTRIKKRMFFVYFPQGHSIRIDEPELKRMGYHLRPRLVDMDTGEVIDHGGDPYDFGLEDDAAQGENIELIDDEDTNPTEEPSNRKAK